MAVSIPIRPSTTQAMQAASSSGTDSRSSDGCRDCVKVGLAILPVVPTAVPKVIRGLNEEIRQLDSRYQASDLSEHWMVLRTLPQGYLYVMKPDLSWDIYVVDAEGLLRMAPSQAACPETPAEQPPMKAACKRTGDHIPAQVIAIDPTKHAAVWLAFSRYKWDDSVLKAYARNEEGCRTKRMVKIDVMAAAAGSLGMSSNAANAVRFGVPMSASVRTVVADFASQATRDLINKHSLEPLRDRSEQAGPLALAMAKMSGQTAGKTGAVIALTDDLGVARTLNADRNMANLERARISNAFARHQFVNSAAKGFEAQFKKHGQAQRWVDVYAKAYNPTLLSDQLKEHDRQILAIDTKLKGLADDWTAWMKRPGLAALVAHDFDSSDITKGRKCSEAVADCLHGAGSQASERTLIAAWRDGKVSDPDNILWRALAANNKKLLERLEDPTDLAPPSVDTAKNAWGAADAYAGYLSEKEEALLKAVRFDKAEPLADALGRIMHTVATVTDQGIGGMRRCILIAALWGAVRIAPVQVRLTPAQATMEAKIAGWGVPPRGRVQQMRKVNKTSWSFELLEVMDVLKARGGVAVSLTRYAVVEVYRKTGWVNVGKVVDVPDLPSAAHPVAPLTPKPSVGPTARPGLPPSLPTQPNWLGRGMALLRHGGVNTVGASAILFFQYKSLNKSLDELNAASSDNKAAELTIAYFAAMAGMVGAASELTGSAIILGKHLTGHDVKAFLSSTTRSAGMTRGALAIGGVMGGVSGAAMGVSSLVQAYQLDGTGDHDSANWTYALGVASIAGGLTSGLGALGVTLVGIGPVGWALLTVGLVGAAFYFAFKAGEAKDDPIESWLKRSVVGYAPEKMSAAEEVKEYNQLFTLPLEVSLEGGRAALFDVVNARISAPALDEESQLRYRLEIVNGDTGKTHVVEETLQLKTARTAPTLDPELRPGRAHRPLQLTDFSKLEDGKHRIHYQVKATKLVRGQRDPATGTVQLAEKRYMKQVRLVVWYVPLSKSEPEWTLPDGQGRAEQFSVQ